MGRGHDPEGWPGAISLDPPAAWRLPWLPWPHHWRTVGQGLPWLADLLSYRWQIYFRIEEPAIQEQPNRGLPVGVDRGITHTMAVSDGRHLDMPSLLTKGEQRRLRKLELQAARRREVRLRKAGTRISR